MTQTSPASDACPRSASFQEGQKWASNHAETDQLKRLEQESAVVDANGLDWDSSRVVRCVMGEDDWESSDRQEVAEQLGVDDDEDGGGAADFVDGALTFLAAVVD